LRDIALPVHAVIKPVEGEPVVLRFLSADRRYYHWSTWRSVVTVQPPEAATAECGERVRWCAKVGRST
jgi:hypothetical protein